MPFYRVDGLIKYGWGWDETKQNYELWSVDNVVVMARDANEAKRHVLTTIQEHDRADWAIWEWPPDIIELPVDQQLRMMGAVTLPGFEDV